MSQYKPSSPEALHAIKEAFGQAAKTTGLGQTSDKVTIGGGSLGNYVPQQSTGFLNPPYGHQGCPNCGYCPSCGRSNRPGYGNYWAYPHGPYTITCKA